MGERLTGWPVYPRIAGRLRERIASARYPAGGVLPSEAALCEEFHAARNTVRRALAVLEADGLIVTVPSKGRVVRGHDGRSPAVSYLYAVIARDLREQIRTGVLVAGAALPSEATLRRCYAASRNTVRQALALLEREGLIVTEHGRGRFVRKP